MKVKADDVADPDLQLRVGGELEPLDPVRLQAEAAPQPGDAVMADLDVLLAAQPFGQPPAGPVRGPHRGQRIPRRGHRGRQDRADHLLGQYRLWPAGTGRVLQPGQSVLGVLPTPLDDCGLGAADPLGDLWPGQPVGGQQHDPGPFGQPRLRAPVPQSPFQLCPVGFRDRQDAHAIRHEPLPRTLAEN
jgi:hypothetical protein